ncbi:Stress-induced protein UVI31 [Plasmopara halstedii]|uniref:Stress-induced protein UVI31 n=1 Tax=Plasmopara halstedii TaxID=4781 RepID=A0A0P1A6A6_PLAHL|nr:Stress-induced protein UVI31 [Plasmopara halstedii]CEG36113.1 Stress-induced protein UVI31 [Plasmopara halstedii]|eukprot:XP_024572482.1 Stress-induced protein UVI31 [Plasmopara halstedii]
MNHMLMQFRRRIMNDTSGPIARRIHEKLLAAFAPSHLDVINESHMHNVPKGSETHFKVVVISNEFDNISLLQRHRMVNTALQQELDEGVHALSILSKTPKQWEDSSQVKPSPSCRGGMAVDSRKKEFLKDLEKRNQSD